MKKKILSVVMLAIAGLGYGFSSDLVILTTNDTHSNIDTDASGQGGILQRKAIVDSVRGAEKNVLLIDAGDMVQGSLYFKYFRGDVEYPLFNMMGYDVRILGNHEFDNGLDQLAKYWKNVKGERLSANYDFSGTVAEGIFKPYMVKKIGGKKIGIIGINVDPESLISKENYEGMKFLPVIATAEQTAEYLRKEKKCDVVVAVTHIGYANDNGSVTDVDLAKESRNIDIIVGGHSHTFVDPSNPEKTPYWIKNADGREVLVTQTGKYGRNVGYIKIDLDTFGKNPEKDTEYRYIAVTDRFSPEKLDSKMAAFLKPYSVKVDSVNNLVIGKSGVSMQNHDRKGGLANFTGDMALWLASRLRGKLAEEGVEVPEADFSIMNVGGIRQNMPEGDITEGQILSTYPFSNRMQLISVKGKNVIDALAVAARKGGESVSGNIRVVTDSDSNLKRVVLNGEEIDPERDYVVATIDYIAAGNDNLTPLADHLLLWSDPEELSVRVLEYIRHLSGLGLMVMPDLSPRFVEEVVL